MDSYHIYIYMIIVIKLAFLYFIITSLYYKATGNTEAHNNSVYWKERTDFVFKILMALLLFYIFNPNKDNSYLIDGETKLLFYLFGIIMILTADWENFYWSAKWHRVLVSDEVLP